MVVADRQTVLRDCKVSFASKTNTYLGGILLSPGMLGDEVDTDARLVHGGGAVAVVKGGSVTSTGKMRTCWVTSGTIARRPGRQRRL